MPRRCALLAVTALVACRTGTVAEPLPTPFYGGALACAGHAAPGLADSLLVGFSGTDDTAARPGFDLRYLYVSGALAPQAGCYDPARPNAVGCGTSWWGSWQWEQHPPGEYVTDFVASCESFGELPMLTYYTLLQASGVAEGKPEATSAARDASFMATYFSDFRFLLQKIGAHRALVHVEPDFWGYAQMAAADAGTGATGLPAAVASANPEDCGALPDTIAGLGSCLVHMARLYAPAVRVALHASAWGTYRDCIANTDASLDVTVEGAKTAAFLAACGAGAADLVVVDIADRDAGWRDAQGQNTWLDATDRNLPTFAQAFRWSRAVADGLGKPLLWWQVPVGNSALSNQAGAWRDNKVEYFFAHPDRVADSGAIGMAFGAGTDGQTTPESDGGYLWGAAAALASAGGQPLCE